VGGKGLIVTLSVCSFAKQQIGDQSSKYLHLTNGNFRLRRETSGSSGFCFQPFEEHSMPQRFVASAMMWAGVFQVGY